MFQPRDIFLMSLRESVLSKVVFKQEIDVGPNQLVFEQWWLVKIMYNMQNYSCLYSTSEKSCEYFSYNVGHLIR